MELSQELDEHTKCVNRSNFIPPLLQLLIFPWASQLHACGATALWDYLRPKTNQPGHREAPTR
jgi:hypothetical protein